MQDFSPEEVRAILEMLHHKKLRRPWAIRAMILLGINCGFGNADCGRLEFANLDLKNGWANYHREKTETDRRCFLWPETIDAINRAVAERPAPRLPEHAERVFLTKYGDTWSDGGPSSALTKRFKWLMKRAGVRRVFRGFYGLRRTFRTLADEASDQPAAMFVMGHVPPPDDMSAVYRQRISDERLKAVAMKSARTNLSRRSARLG